MLTRRTFNSIAIASSLTGASTAWAGTSAPSGAEDSAAPGTYEAQTVSFPSSGETLSGMLLMPASGGPHPAVAIIGPVAFVKEQSPLQYATRFASRGLAVLIFDPCYHGESPGAPRRYESGDAKIKDCQAALDFLTFKNGIDANRLHLLGI